MNRSFFSAREIYVKLASIYRDKMTSYEPYTIMRWCAEVLTDFIKDPSGTLETSIELGKPVNKWLALPPNIFSISRVYDATSGSLVSFSHQGDRLLFGDNDINREIKIDCRILAMDNDGFPMLPRGYEKACEAYCEYNMFKPDFMEGRINGQQWSEIVNTKDWEIEAASRSWDQIDDNEAKEIMNAQVNIGYKLLRK